MKQKTKKPMTVWMHGPFLKTTSRRVGYYPLFLTKRAAGVYASYKLNSKVKKYYLLEATE